MKVMGMALFGVGFLAGAFFLVQQLDAVHWGAFAGSLVVCGLGVLLMRLADRSNTQTQQVAQANVQRLEASLDRLMQALRAINAEREEIGVYGIHGQLDERLIDDLDAFVSAREALIYHQGLAYYAKVMDGFAAGERALNRAWSASADGYLDEVWACLDRAERAFQRARDAMTRNP